MFIFLRLAIFAAIISGLWMYQPPILKQEDPVIAQQEKTVQTKAEQIIEGARYQMNDNGVVWDVFANKAIAKKDGIFFQHPHVKSADGRFFSALEGYWSFADQKIYFTGGLTVIDPSKNLELHGTKAFYDIVNKELLFDESIQGQYAGDF